MTITEPLDSTTMPDIGPTRPCCRCGHCLADDDYSETELALDACLTHMLERISIVKTSTRKARRRTWISLRVMHELVDDVRKLLCVQRQTMRTPASLRARR